MGNLANKPRGVLVAGNWKMNYGPKEAAKFFQTLESLIPSARLRSQDLPHSVRACIFPPFIALQEVQMHLQAACLGTLGIPAFVGAQNAHWEKKGAFTGEISGPMLHELGINWVLVGHSERRQHFGETDQTVHLRAKSLLEQGFTVILCIGETRIEREQNQTAAVLTRQFRSATSDLKPYSNGKLILAYEPVWAIGTGLTATPEQAEEAHTRIRHLIREDLGESAADSIPLLYGGSVTPENIASLLSCANVDGVLVGGASLKPEGFLAMLEAGVQVY